jgi:hypothetical protein
MGYRSEVLIAFTEENNKSFLGSVHADVASFFKNDSDIHKLDGWILYRFDSIKWYDEYKEVSEVINFINKLEKEGNRGYEFHRLGEGGFDHLDHETRGEHNSPFNIYTKTCITFDA